jgi:Icc-related predicted phosphoesterase
VPGNHDFCFEEYDSRSEALEILTEAECLIDKAVTVGGYELWGAPWQPKFFDWAFNRERGKELREKWNLIPDSTDILVTHGPPHGIGDEVTHGEQVGCRELRKRVKTLQPRYHLFGHIHEGYGRYNEDGLTYVNCSVCDVRTLARNQPIVLEL